MTEAQRERQRERQRRYSKTVAGKATQARYIRSAKGKATQARYARSAKGLARDARSIFVGEVYRGQAQTVEQAAMIRRHIKERTREFISR